MLFIFCLLVIYLHICFKSNSKYIPPNSTTRSNASQPVNRSVNEFRISDYSNDILNINEPPDSRGTNNHSLPPQPRQPIQKRVQIVDHNRQTSSVDYISERESHNSYSPETNSATQKPRSRRDTHDDNKSDSTRSNNFNIHEYLYGLSAPDPGLLLTYRNKGLSRKQTLFFL